MTSEEHVKQSLQPPKNGKVLSVVVPVFRNSESLDQLHSEIAGMISGYFPQLDLEVLFVDDGSDDRSWEVISKIRMTNPGGVSAYRLTRNFGQLGAMVKGYELATGDAVVSISADLQDPSELIVPMVEHWLSGSELVIAHRVDRSDGLLSAVTSKIAYAYARSTVKKIPPGGFDFFLMSRRVTNDLIGFKGRFRFLQGDLLWLGYPTVLLPYERRKRPHGTSGYSLRKRLGNFTDLVIDSSYGPLKVLSSVGVIGALTGVIYASTVVASWFAGQTPFAGWAPLMIVTLLMSGTVLIMLGIISSYLWRIYDQVRERPMSVVMDSFPRKEDPKKSSYHS
jgi:glycosyltransferase involved in cell wall biosynthesis